MSPSASPFVVQSPAVISLNSTVSSPAENALPTVPNPAKVPTTNGRANVLSSPTPSPPSSLQKSRSNRGLQGAHGLNNGHGRSQGHVHTLSGGSGSAAANSDHVQGLLVPTDRLQEDLEQNWISKLGRLRVVKEVVLRGYALYAVRQWYLSRDHWTQTIVTQTGKQSESISLYLLLPSPDLSAKQASLELAAATQFLAQESGCHPRKTEHGTLLVTTPSSFGQDLVVIVGGDFREAKPYMVVNTDLRRLGCGGRALLAIESPIPAIRRKFYELYRLPNPLPAVPLSRNASPTTSPSKNGREDDRPALANGSSPKAAMTDTFVLMVIELVKIIQSALVLWGMVDEGMPTDGLFCDDTKKGIFAWRRAMGMEHEESMRLEKETSGGCIDPKTLAALLSSITSVRYQMAVLDADRLPKNPFSNTRKFLHAWHAYHLSAGVGSDKPKYLTVASIRRLHTQYLNERTRHPDAFKVHRLLASSVVSATSSLSANLKGGSAEDAPLRKREHHLRHRGEDGPVESGVGLIIPEGEVGGVAPPDIITTDLDAYIKGILKSREKDWDVMGARRVAWLWSGEMDLKRKPSNRLDRMMRIRSQTRDPTKTDDGEDSTDAGRKGTFGKVTQKTGQVIKGGLGLVSRRTTMDETSDSDLGGPGSSSRRNALSRQKQGSLIPTVVEPDVEEVENQLDPEVAALASQTPSRLHVDRLYGTASSIRPSLMSGASRPSSKQRISVLTNFSMDDSDRSVRAGSYIDDRTENGDANPELERPGASVQALSLLHRERSKSMLRTTSDGADVALDDGGLEWTVVNPHGVFKGQRESDEGIQALKRTRSLQDRLHYRNTIVSPVEHLAIDVDMCSVVMELRDRERRLAARSKDLKTLESSIFKASQDLIDAIRDRRRRITELKTEAQTVSKDLHKVLDDVDEDEALQWANKKIQFYLSEDVNLNELMWNLRSLERDWERVRRKIEEGREAVARSEEKSSWWKFGL